MKRRLSIGIALLGDPKIIFLDEPTTGMDPCTRREVWDMIEKAKRDRVIFLTTHSMEEADILGDRVCVMSHGKIQALGTTLSMKNKHGSGFKISIVAKDGKAAEVKGLVDGFVAKTAGIILKLNAALGNVLEYQLARDDDVSIATSFFKFLEEIKANENAPVGFFRILQFFLAFLFVLLSCLLLMHDQQIGSTVFCGTLDFGRGISETVRRGRIQQRR